MRYARILRKYHSAQESCSFVHVLCTFVLSCYKAISGQKKFGRGERFCLSSQRRPTSDWITSFVDDEIAETIPSLFERRRDKKKKHSQEANASETRDERSRPRGAGRKSDVQKKSLKVVSPGETRMKREIQRHQPLLLNRGLSSSIAVQSSLVAVGKLSYLAWCLAG